MSEEPDQPSADAGAGNTSGTYGENHVPEPNHLLIAARHAKPSERKPGQWMSRSEVTALANAYIRERDGANSAYVMGEGVLGKLERGEHRAPRDAARREALRHVLGVQSDADLGWPPRLSPPRTTPVRRVAAASCGGTVALDAAVDLGAMMDAAASDVEQVASSIDARAIPAITFQRYRSRLVGLSTDFVHTPAAELFPQLYGLWKDIAVYLRNGPRQHQRRDLYLVAGMTCVVLAHASHVLGRPHDGMVHVEAALLWAREAGHRELLAWTQGTKALLVESTRGPVHALQVLQEAQDVLARSSRPGTGAVRLACYEARFSALARQRDRALAAVRASEDAAEALGAGALSELDDIGGILTFGEPKRASFCAGPYLDFGHPGLAERHAQAAIAGYLRGPAEQHSYGDVALARVSMAQARLSAGDLDGVMDAVHPVLTLPPQKRITPLHDPLKRLAAALREPRYVGSAQAAGIRDGITDFQRRPKVIMSV